MTKLPTVTYFFLGANSQNGFYSLYEEFAAAPKDILHIIKGGPGTGKSTFMKRIGKAAEEKGLDVEYILCSGDPQSLDGVYIPALHMGWADGTAPHILEPKHFGIDGTYIDLGQFCRTSILTDQRDAILAQTAAYRLCYKKAYLYLQAAGTLRRFPSPLPSQIEDRIRARARAKTKKELSAAKNRGFRPVKRFLRAISCTGNYIPVQTLDVLCGRICVLESHMGLESIFFDEILSEANSRGVFYIQCPDPLSPQLTEAVIFPELRLGFLAAHITSPFSGTQRTIHLDSYCGNQKTTDDKQREKDIQRLMHAAYAQLSHAKQHHDVLEQCYRPALDVDGLNAYSQAVVKDVFS